MTPQDLKKCHDNYVAARINATREMWNNGTDLYSTMREKYGKDELSLHIMLEHECFYCLEIKQRNMPKALYEIKRFYANTTMYDLERVYEQYKDVVSEVYG